ncbi:Riboflavin synthase [Phytophthora nicotianae]|uniref:Riboflavin synthase n=1 Tax=Phytophthora nicotianae TaxID=4792 RepID=A0A0W8CV73_PHYNI|nr:Riboflavin synthase [Phytophthora nicotianae]
MARKVWFQLVDAATRDAYAGTQTASVSSDDVNNIDDLREAIFTKVSPALPANVIVANFLFYANREIYDEENGQPLDEDLAIGALGASKKGALIVVVPTQRFQQLQRPLLEIPQVDWTMASCSQLVVEDKAELIELPPSCVDGTGIGRSGGPLMLYRRPSLVKQWNEMDRCSIQTYALLWIVGPPGTGKSCTALAFACALDRAYWDVLWIHYSRRYEYFNCVRLHGNMKAVCVIKEETIDRDLPAILNGTSQERQTIVFLDGYVKSSKAGEAARLKCKRWHQENEIKHRLVCICSMATLELSHKGIDWSYWEESTMKRDRWEQSDVVFFDPDKHKVSVSLDDPTWMAPVKWNQGGYDAVFVNKRENLVRFVQVTRAGKHTFDPTYFVALLNKLAAGALNQIAVVELCFVVPMARLEGFVLPVSEDDFQRNVVQVASSEPRATRSSVDQTFQNCNGKVMVIGL